MKAVLVGVRCLVGAFLITACGYDKKWEQLSEQVAQQESHLAQRDREREEWERKTVILQDELRRLSDRIALKEKQVEQAPPIEVPKKQLPSSSPDSVNRMQRKLREGLEDFMVPRYMEQYGNIKNVGVNSPHALLTQIFSVEQYELLQIFPLESDRVLNFSGNPTWESSMEKYRQLLRRELDSITQLLEQLNELENAYSTLSAMARQSSEENQFNSLLEKTLALREQASFRAGSITNRLESIRLEFLVAQRKYVDYLRMAGIPTGGAASLVTALETRVGRAIRPGVRGKE